MSPSSMPTICCLLTKLSFFQLFCLYLIARYVRNKSFRSEWMHSRAAKYDELLYFYFKFILSSLELCFIAKLSFVIARALSLSNSSSLSRRQHGEETLEKFNKFTFAQTMFMFSQRSPTRRCATQH